MDYEPYKTYILFILFVIMIIILILIISYCLSKKISNNINNIHNTNYNTNYNKSNLEKEENKKKEVKSILNNFMEEKKNILEALVIMINHRKFNEINLNLILININNLYEICFKISCIMKYYNSYKRYNLVFFLDQALLITNYKFKQSNFIKFGKFGIPHNKSIMLNELENKLIADKINSLKIENNLISYQEINIIINTDYKIYLNELYNILNKIQQNNNIKAIIEEEFNKDIEIIIE